MSRNAPALAPRRTGRRRLTVTVVVLAVVVGLLVLADRISVRVAESVVASHIQDSQHLMHKPTVDIDGFPFLTQLAAADFDTVSVTAHDLPVGDSGHRAELSTLTTVLHGVHTSRDFHRVRADTLTATGTATLAQLSSATGLTLTGVGGGRVSTTKSLSAFGETVSVTVSSKPVAADGALTFTDTRIDDAGSLIGAISEKVTSLFDLRVPLDDVPFGLKARSVTVTGSQVRFTFTGTDVDLTSGASAG